MAQDTIPNLPLNGKEMAAYIGHLFRKVLSERDVLDSRQLEEVATCLDVAMKNDYAFLANSAYPRVQIEITAQFHSTEGRDRFAFSISPTLYISNPTYPKHEVFVRRPVGMAAPPIEGYFSDEVHTIDCFLMRFGADNPNLIRVHCGIPIVITNQIPPQFGEAVGKIESVEIRYDPHDYPPMPQPEVIDQTEGYAKSWGIPEYLGLELRTKEEHAEVAVATPVIATSEAGPIRPPVAKKRTR